MPDICVYIYNKKSTLQKYKIGSTTIFNLEILYTIFCLQWILRHRYFKNKNYWDEKLQNRDRYFKRVNRENKMRLCIDHK